MSTRDRAAAPARAMINGAITVLIVLICAVGTAAVLVTATLVVQDYITPDVVCAP